MIGNFLKTATVVATLAVGCLHAQQLKPAIQADVPFAFQAGKTMLPAGTYTVAEYAPDVIRITGDDRRSVLVLTNGCQRPDAQRDNVLLVFNKYGNRHFLWKAWSLGAGGRELPRTAVERELARSGAAEIATIRAHMVLP